MRPDRRLLGLLVLALVCVADADEPGATKPASNPEKKPNAIMSAYREAFKSGSFDAVERVDAQGDALLEDWIDAIVRGDWSFLPGEESPIDRDMTMAMDLALHVAQSVLGDRTDPDDKAVKRISQALTDSAESSSQTEALRAISALSIIGRARPDEVVPVLAAQVAGADTRRAISAGGALFNLGRLAAPAHDALTKQLKAEEVGVRMVAALVLIRTDRNAEEAQEALRAISAPDAPWPADVRAEAQSYLQSLSRIRDPKPLEEKPDLAVPQGKGEKGRSGTYVGPRPPYRGPKGVARTGYVLELRPDGRYRHWTRWLGVFLDPSQPQPAPVVGSWMIDEKGLRLQPENEPDGARVTGPGAVGKFTENGVVLVGVEYERLPPPSAESEQRPKAQGN